MNVYHGPPGDRPLRTGLHVVSDLYCCQCHVNVGWYYNLAYEEAQKYKEHKAILVENTIYKQDAARNTSSRRAAHDSGRRMRDEEEEEEEDDEEEQQDDEDEPEEEEEEDEGQREGRAREGGGRRSGWLELQSQLLPAASTPLPLTTAVAAAVGLISNRPAARTAPVRIRVPHAPAAS